ncbi:LPS assembly lipoprotein LptE [Ectopseudomonas mendocina]|uniref:LPS-assembly lipoprotein LptE n=1 Tax=Ectopseudomonas mendocina TaxID=300 RepID=A0ABZ2RIR2_ECTME
MIKRNLLVIGLATLLSACGFQLRGTGDIQFALKELDVSARNEYGDTVKELTQSLNSNGVRVYPGAPYHLVLASEQENRRAATFTSAARTAEYELTKTIEYEIRGSKNAVLLNDKVEANGFYNQDGNNLIGGDQEAEQLRKEMRRELIQQLLQNIRQITPEKLDELQSIADAKAQAEAEALEAARQREAAEPQASPITLPVQIQ